jgi:LAO/AO transport system kinase
VGVVAVDPTSPFSGGAVLGDRVRMQQHFNDPDVFIRSVGTRGKSGGISFATRALMQILDASGCDVILVETVGAGQSEVDVADLVDTTVVVLVPEAGDAIQALKAGILEIADVFAVNKKDRPGAENVATHLEAMLTMVPSLDPWKPPIVLTEAQSGQGIDELWAAVERHHSDLSGRGLRPEERFRRRLHELSEVIEARIAGETLAACRSDPSIRERLSTEARPNLYAVAEDFLRDLRTDRAAKRPRAKSGK